jgi:hypothetical protein
MFDQDLELRIHETPWYAGYEIAFFSKKGDKQFIGEPVVMRELPPNAYVDEPTARMSRTVMQGLFNELWRLGFRPADGTGNSGHVEALKYHLEDMRKLVFSGPSTRQSESA